MSLENQLYLQLEHGRVMIDLLPDLAPNHVERIKQLSREGFYENLTFHRVVEGFVAQTGDPTGTGFGGSGQFLDAELSTESFVRGTVGMARGSDLNSGDSQFFICLADATFLTGLYTLWGKVSSGMDYADLLSVGEPPTLPDRMLSLQVAEDIVSPQAITFLGGAGDDQFQGGSGNDFIDGGLGNDRVIFSAEKTAYSITEIGRNVVITDNQANRDGSDTLSSVENFQFSDGTFQLSELLNVTDIDRGIYRFFNIDTGTHFLSGSTVERDSVINNLDSFNFEGPAFRAADPANSVADTVFRFFNTQTGTHFFTQSTAERDNILDTIPQFSFEGEAYKGYSEQVDGSIPLYRFFNTQTGTHFYTAAEAEKDSIIDNLPSFNFEGTAYWVDLVMG